MKVEYSSWHSHIQLKIIIDLVTNMYVITKSNYVANNFIYMINYFTLILLNFIASFLKLMIDVDCSVGKATSARALWACVVM